MLADGDLYHRDFYAWTQAQAHAVRAAANGGNQPIDWENLAEEIEALGRSERREVTSRLRTIIEHLLKLAVSPAVAPRRDWTGTVPRTRLELDDILRESPSLRPEIPALVRELGPKIAKLVAQDLEGAGEATPAVLGDWLPERPG